MTPWRLPEDAFSSIFVLAIVSALRAAQDVTMTVSLPEDIERRLEAEVAAGRAESVEAAAAAVIRAQLASMDDLRRSLDEAEADYDLNGGVPWADVRKRFARD